MANYTETPEQIKEIINSRVKIIDNCWVWQNRLTNAGYGTIAITRVGGKKGHYSQSAHRISYEAYKGRVGENMVIDHLCRNRMCVNPEHLEEVDQLTNLMRGVGTVAKINKNKTHCKNGHEFNQENTYEPPKRTGRRYCKKCQSVRGKERIAS